MLTLNNLTQREAEIKEALRQQIARAEQMRGALECIALLKKDCEAAEAEQPPPPADTGQQRAHACQHGVPIEQDCDTCYEEAKLAKFESAA